MDLFGARLGRTAFGVSVWGATRATATVIGWCSIGSRNGQHALPDGSAVEPPARMCTRRTVWSTTCSCGSPATHCPMPGAGAGQLQAPVRQLAAARSAELSAASWVRMRFPGSNRTRLISSTDSPRSRAASGVSVVRSRWPSGRPRRLSDCTSRRQGSTRAASWRAAKPSGFACRIARCGRGRGVGPGGRSAPSRGRTNAPHHSEPSKHPQRRSAGRQRRARHWGSRRGISTARDSSAVSQVRSDGCGLKLWRARPAAAIWPDTEG